MKQTKRPAFGLAGAKSKGFTLIEILIGIIIIGILGSVVLSNVDTKKAKVTTLLDNARTFQTALARFNADTGCYPVRIEALFDSTQATGTATDTGFCTSNVAGAITAPYIDALAYDATAHAINLPKIGATTQVTTTYDAANNVWFMTITGLPIDLVDMAVRECNGQDAAATVPTAWSLGVKCIKSTNDVFFAFNRA